MPKVDLPEVLTTGDAPLIYKTLGQLRALEAGAIRLDLAALRELEKGFPVLTSAQFRLVQRQFERNPNGENFRRLEFTMYVWQQQHYKPRSK